MQLESTQKGVRHPATFSQTLPSMKILTSNITAIFKTAGVVLQVTQLVVTKMEDLKESIPCPWWIQGRQVGGQSFKSQKF